MQDINVTGTSSGLEKQKVVDIECSTQCQDITAVGTHLTPPNGTATYTCLNVASAAELDFPCSTNATAVMRRGLSFFKA
jgi:galacturan 1,4-alpha-galacturonidase